MERRRGKADCLTPYYKWASELGEKADLENAEPIRAKKDGRSCEYRANLSSLPRSHKRHRERKTERRTYLVAGLQRALPFQSSRIAGQVFLVVTFIFLFQLLSGFFQFVEELKSNIRVTQSSAYLQESSWNPINHMGPSVPQFQLPINDSYCRRQNLGFWRVFFFIY